MNEATHLTRANFMLLLGRLHFLVIVVRKAALPTFYVSYNNITKLQIYLRSTDHGHKGAMQAVNYYAVAKHLSKSNRASSFSQGQDIRSINIVTAHF